LSIINNDFNYYQGDKMKNKTRLESSQTSQRILGCSAAWAEPEIKKKQTIKAMIQFMPSPSNVNLES
jgi:hypothetical protein